jgi:hypothetical protein
MRYFFDTEFIESGSNEPIYLISMGMVSEDGRELYLENFGCPYLRANSWVEENVFPSMNSRPILDRVNEKYYFYNVESSILKYPEDIREAIIDFIGNDPKPEFWAYYADYDWVVFCQLFGTMMDLPKGYKRCSGCELDIKNWGNNSHYIGNSNDEDIYCKELDGNYILERAGKFPMFCRDVKQLAVMLDNPTLPKQCSIEHNALNDAKWTKEAFDYLKDIVESRKIEVVL